MKKWVTTSWMYQTFGCTAQTEQSPSDRYNVGSWSRTYYTTDYGKLQTKLEELTDYCNRNQYSVKSILPLTNAQTFDSGKAIEYSSLVNGVVAAAGIGQGWAFSNVVGFAALLERIEEISDEEYERRCAQQMPSHPAPGIVPPPLPVEFA